MDVFAFLVAALAILWSAPSRRRSASAAGAWSWRLLPGVSATGVGGWVERACRRREYFSLSPPGCRLVGESQVAPAPAARLVSASGPGRQVARSFIRSMMPEVVRAAMGV